MTESTAAPPPPSTLRLGIFAPPAGARSLAAALGGLEGVAIAGQAGLAQSDALPGIDWFADERVMLAQGGLHALLIQAGPRLALAMARQGIEHGLHVWMAPPIGRSFSDAAELIRRSRELGPILWVSSWWRTVREEVRAILDRDEGRRFTLCELRVAAPGPQIDSWWASAAEGGGGVLPAAAYGLIEALLALRGIPENLFAAVGRCRTRSSQTPRETEDVGVAVLRYEGAAAATIQATWDIEPYEAVLRGHAPDKTLELTESAVRLATTDGSSDVVRDLPADQRVADIAKFIREIRGGRPSDETRAAGEHHASVSALLESIYLSSRTGQPESPRQLFEAQGWSEPRR